MTKEKNVLCIIKDCDLETIQGDFHRLHFLNYNFL